MYRNRIGLTFTLLLVAVSGSINAMDQGSDDQHQFTLHIGRYQYEEARELLLSGQVDVRKMSRWGSDLLNYAVQSISSDGVRECPRFLKKRTMDRRGQDLHNLIAEMLRRRGPLVKEEQSEDEKRELQDTLSHAVAQKFIPAKTVRALLEYGVKPEKMLDGVYDPDTKKSFLGCAIGQSTAEKVRALLEHGADPQDGTPLNFGYPCSTEPEAAELLAFWGADPEGALRSLPYWPEMRNAIMRGVEERQKSLATVALCLEEKADATSEVPCDVMNMFLKACGGESIANEGVPISERME